MNYCHQSKAALITTLLAPYVEAFTDHFNQGNYSPVTVAGYYHCFTRFSHWLKQNTVDIHDINEEVIEQFLAKLFPVDLLKQEGSFRRAFHAALGHILVLLLANAVISPAPIKKLW